MNVITARKKPVVITAIQWNNNEPEIREFVPDDALLRFSGKTGLRVYNTTEQDWIDVNHLHYIIKGTKGEFYPCSPEVFEQVYDLVED